ncbi:hypothetical protein [Alkaliphilus transvaalensis]|uniref:hypothetical protein n=1 Tax=Alkaliphilus transvaalensis TaxID=114628 RepID=UPI000479277F|nr:hypothetical protein [Alkaliphilus transvaalensis]
MSERIEKIIRDYPQLIMERTCLEHQLRNFTGITETEMIESMYFNHPEGERVQTSGVSEKTANIAITYKDKMQKMNQEWQEHLEKKYAIISEEIIFFESAIAALSGNLSEFIWDMVIGGLTWDDLACKYHISRTMVAKYRKKAIRELEILYAINEKEMAEYILS